MAFFGCCFHCLCSDSSSSFPIVVVVVFQSLPFHCAALVASYYSSHHRHEQYRLTMTRSFGAPRNEDDNHHHRRQQRYRSFVLSILWLFVESGRVVAIVSCASVSLIDCIRRPFDDADSECRSFDGERDRRCWHARTLYRSRTCCHYRLSHLCLLCVLTIVIIVVNDIHKRAGPCCSVLLLIVFVRLVGALML